MSVVATTYLDEVAFVRIANPPVNALSLDVRTALWDLVPALDDNPALKAVILLCEGRTFIAGADVSEFGAPPLEPHLPDLVNRIEHAAKPWIAAIHGSALGGGLELAMGCRFRIAVAGAFVGLPEVTLGLIPGASGTVRTPRLIGVGAAVDLITNGRPIPVERAASLGLIDAVVHGDLEYEANAFARNILDQCLPPKASERRIPTETTAFWAEQETAILKRSRGEIAPRRAAACIRNATEVGFEEAMRFERSTFLELRGSQQALALRSLFFAERNAARPPHLKDVPSRELLTAAVVGGGTMGCGIVAALRDGGLPTVLIERDPEAVARSVGNLRAIFEGAVKRGRLSDAQAKDRMAGVTATTDYAALADVDLVIEAVFENLAVKRAVFSELERHCRSDTILATNTSYIDPREIASGLTSRKRFIGLHFFSPANVMRLLEIVPVPETSPETLATAFALSRKLSKLPIQAGICEGFIGNRILKRYRAAAETLVRDGVPISDIDAAMRTFGFAMGPFEAQDLGGLDIAHRQREGARAAGKHVDETLADILVRAGRIGQKKSAGWYDYAAGNRTPIPSKAVSALLGQRIGPVVTMAPEIIASLLVAEMSAEGRALLSEGVAQSETDIDLVEIHGYGFPRWTGGPMFATRDAADAHLPEQHLV